MTYPPDNVAACCLIMKQCFNTFIMFNLTFKTMKRFLTMLMAVSAVFAVSSCDEKGGDEPTPTAEPTMTWAGNENFEAELTTEMDVQIQITAEAGIKSFVVGIDSDVLNPIISAVNGGSTDMDLINGPAELIALLGTTGIPTGDALAGETELSLNLSNLVPLIITMGQMNGTLVGGSDHVFTLTLTDNEDRSLSQDVVFHYLAPTITWPSNPTFSVVDIDGNLDASLSVNAPAGINSFVVSVDSGALEGALGAIGITTTDLDLINDATVIGILDVVTQGQLPTGENLLNQTSVDFNITSLVTLIPALGEDGSEHSFTLNLSDNNGNELSKTCTFRVVK